ncbi:MAG: glycosyltransferase [Chitinophagales bacterium]|nr:glycosyltransferase [Chitinophagales bacterium]
MTPIISICITAYNHEKFIAQAINSIISQQTTYSYEIIIGVDPSNDNTLEICTKYQLKHPDIIKILINSNKDKIYLYGKASGRFNFLNNLTQAKGKYIALLDGDDFWIDNNKIQTQLDFLEKNEHYVVCWHQANKINSEGKYISTFPDKTRMQSEKIMSNLYVSNFIPTGSTVFRNGLLDFSTSWFKYTPYIDWSMHIMLLNLGKGHFFDIPMSAYRIHEGGIHSQLINTDRGIQLLFKQYCDFFNILKDKHIPNWGIKQHKLKYFQNLCNLIHKKSTTIKNTIRIKFFLRLLFSYNFLCKKLFQND